MSETLGEAVDRDGVSEAFLAMAQMLTRRGRAPVKDKVVTEKVGRWTVVMNGKLERVSVEPEGTLGCDNIPACHAAIFYNGWLAGLLSPAGGWIAAGEAADESTFIEAMSSAK